MNHIARAISNSIKEGKWLSITYSSSTEGRDTSFWCAVSDVDSASRSLKVDIFNSEKNKDALLGKKIYFDKIKEASVIDFSTFPTPVALIDKLEHHPEQYPWLHYENFNNNILMYLQECNRFDNDPFQKNFTMLEGLDLATLKASKSVALNDEQIDQIVKAIYYNDIKRYTNASNEMALSTLAIDISGKKYVIAYYTVCFNPSNRTLSLVGSVHFNSTYMIEESKHCLSQYLDMTTDEFIEEYKKDPIEATQILKDGIRGGEKIDTRPNFMILERSMIVNLANLFESIEDKRDAGTLSVPLKAFFGDISVRNNGRKEPAIVIFNHKINIDQMRVLYNSMKNPVTYVQGPPGTGKTQTLFNVIVSAYFNNRSVLVCSMNNKPVDGIIEKLTFSSKGETIPFPMLRLGNEKEMAKATLQIRHDFDATFHGTPQMNKIADIKNEEVAKNSKLIALLTQYEERKAVEDNIARAKHLQSLLTKPNSRLEDEIANLTAQRDALPVVTNEAVVGLFSEASKSSRYLTYLYFSSIAHLARLKQPKYTELRAIVAIEDDKTRVSQFNTWLSDDDNLALLVDVYPTIFSTNVSAGRLGTGRFMFDLTVMDEAGQCDIAKSLIPISRGNSLLLVGDKDQLQPVVVLDPTVNERLKEKYHISHNYDYIDNSIITLMQNADNISKRIMLTYHYRCAKKIISFSNQYFYGQSLNLSFAKDEGQLALADVHNGTKTSRNECYDEAKAIVDYVKRNQVNDAVVITPFLAQQHLLTQLLSEQGIKDVTASTIHSVQGAEKKTIIISPAVSERTSERTFQWLSSHKEIANVAVTRAQENLLVFADQKAVENLSKKQDNVWLELLKYAKSKGEYKVVPPTADTPNIGKSNGSTNEDEFFKTMAQLCSVYKNYRFRRNVNLSEVFPDDPDFANSKQEFDSVVYLKRTLFRPKRPFIAFEINGGEHFGDAHREELDRKKRELCQKKNLILITIDNGTVKDYEYLREMIRKMNHEDYEQLPLF